MKAMRALRGIIFDLDGTLQIPPSLDLDALRQKVLSNPDHLTREQLEHACQLIKIAQRQRRGCNSAIPGVKEVCEFVGSIPLHRGIVTLSSKDEAERFQAELHTTFSPILGKEYPSLKPFPEPLLHVCKQWGVKPEDVLMVGDMPRYDIGCGNSAGALTCLVDPLYRYKDVDKLPPQHRPTFRVNSLNELPQLIQRHFRTR